LKTVAFVQLASIGTRIPYYLYPSCHSGEDDDPFPRVSRRALCFDKYSFIDVQQTRPVMFH